ncbi:hypothetical protein P255_02256 [Acinetobacter brisouii CIP 110357]|uniref:LPS-assembly lipoprotein LptE n=1 Tax=Acinetobacter brisouii CIP 110357 TaxID=1341683 RepID=V2UNS6_9GAMM|nr:LPS assembly lipoprotein LptE [Acinetobacter brisouii]ENV46978.1 hypothetical protein F954_01773 [Acinetobacter brisouii ANC 4119]ESK50280.1 hypothetical protein P255_02256 [Acinetobacter brisouii CIP 110357]
MHLVPRLASVVLTLGLSASLVGCGFHLKGLSPTSIPVAYPHMKLNLPSEAMHVTDSNNNMIPQKNTLQIKLKSYLSGYGIQFDDAKEAYTLHVLDYHYRRQKLSGRVAEVILYLNVTFQIEDAQGRPVTTPRSINGVKSYQYNVASVNVDDNEQDAVISLLIDDVAQQMARQIATNRLPHLQPAPASTPTVTP